MRAWATVPVLAAVVFAGCLGGDNPAPVAPPGPQASDVLAGLAWSVNHAAAPTPRTEVAVAALDAKIYTIGGFVSGSAASTVVEAYDAARNAWSDAADYPIPLHHSAAVAHAGSIYVFGGYTTNAFLPTNLAFQYDAARDDWLPLSNLPAARGAHAVAVLEGKVYLVGGVGLDGALVRPVHVYDLATSRWSTAPDLPTPRDHLAAAALGNRLYVVGGRQQSLSTNTGELEAYDPAGQAWATRADMPTPRGGLAAAVLRDRLVVIGGEQGSGTFPHVEAYDPAADAWTRLGDLPTPRHGLGAAASGDRLYAMLGGPRPGLAVSGAVESLGRAGA